MNDKLELQVVVVNIDDQTKRFVTFLPESFIFKHGLISDIIVGEYKALKDGELDLENGFLANALFKETIFSFVKTIMVKDQGLVNAASKQKSGWVYVIDQRTPDPQGEVPPSDIIGAFEVIKGSLGDFNSNTNYQINSKNGFVDLGSTRNIAFKKYLKSLVTKDA